MKKKTNHLIRKYPHKRTTASDVSRFVICMAILGAIIIGIMVFCAYSEEIIETFKLLK